MDASEPRKIAGYPALLSDVDVELPPVPGQPAAGALASDSVRLFTVDRFEELVDRGALLRPEDVPEPPYWALVWIGARAIAGEMIAEPPAADARVLDLGCGLGLSGLAAARAGAHVTFVDYVPDCLDFVRASAEAAALKNYDALVVDFTRDRPPARYDLVLAADVVYDPESYVALADFLDAALAGDGTILLTESLRADAKDFLALLAARGFERTTDARWISEEGRRERTWLHRLCRSRS